ncbi:Mis12-Mtw1 family protein, partial [Rhizoctonia solani AG-3 Rhs1AP]
MSMTNRRVIISRSRSPILQDLLKSVQSQAIKRLASGQIDTSISPSRTSNSNKPLPPHPKNITNAQAISKLEAYNQVCQVEDNAWSELIAAYNSQQAQVVAALATTAEKELKEIELDDQWRQGMQLVKEGVGGGAEADDEMSDGEHEIVDQINSLASGSIEPLVYEAYESARLGLSHGAIHYQGVCPQGRDWADVGCGERCGWGRDGSLKGVGGFEWEQS